jgi:hypothetical protein
VSKNCSNASRAALAKRALFFAFTCDVRTASQCAAQDYSISSGKRHVATAITELMKTITPTRIESWTNSETKDWANESFAIAEQAQTKY